MLFPEVVAAIPQLSSFSEFDVFDRDDRRLAVSIFQNELRRLASGTPSETMKFLISCVDRDFADGQVVAINGWTFSLTEVRLLVLMQRTG
jgi:hypothetical protein